MYKTMQRILTVLMLLFLPCAVTAEETLQELPTGTLSLAGAQQLALDNNPSMQKALASVRAAEARLGQAYSAWWPSITATGGYYRNHADIQPDWQPDISVVKNLNEFNAGLEANWLLFDGFARKARTLAARRGVDQARHLEHNAKRLLLQSVSTAYYQAQLAREQMRIALQNMSFNRSLEHNASIRYRVGSAPKSEMLNFSARALQAESDLIDAKKSFRIALTVLGELTALPSTASLDTLYPEPVDTTSAFLAEHETLSPDEQLRHALRERPDLLALQAAVDAARQQKNAAMGAWAPTIAAVAGVDYLKQSDITPEQEEVTAYAGIAAEWKLFTGGKRSAEFQEKKADLLALQADREQKELAVRSAVRQALLDVEAAGENLERRQKSHELTRRIRDDVQKLYTTGAANITRLNEAQTDLVRAAGLAAAGLIEYRLAEEQLLLETGMHKRLQTSR
ncbi:TolC family protein [Prosthecochloris sp. ZM_2]|nr:TolC family protein [Prosthecochloris sp. ZM_2]